MSPVEAQLESALQSDQPLVRLREAVQMVMAEDDLTSAEMLEVLERVRKIHRAKGDTRLEDVTLDAMDFVAGFCSPHMKIPRR